MFALNAKKDRSIQLVMIKELYFLAKHTSWRVLLCKVEGVVNAYHMAIIELVELKFNGLVIDIVVISSHLLKESERQDK